METAAERDTFNYRFSLRINGCALVDLGNVWKREKPLISYTTTLLKKQSFPKNEFKCFKLCNIIFKYDFGVITDCRGIKASHHWLH